jgi:3-phenylpropionate/trans-cinnamate dioxygenase ferredoxin component
VSSHFVNVVKLDELREGYVTRFEVGGRAVILTRTAAGISAFDGTCTHADFQFVTSRLAGGCDIECPMHGACFDAMTGEATHGPAEDALVQHEVQLKDGLVQINASWTATQMCDDVK